MADPTSETRKAQALRLVTINSDQTPGETTRTVPLLNPDTFRPLAGVVATVKLMTKEAYEAIEAKHRVPDRSSGRVEFKVNQAAVILEVIAETLVSWKGVFGADGKPVPVCGAAIKALDGYNQAHLMSTARTPAEPIELDAEVVEASFRESAPVARVAG